MTSGILIGCGSIGRQHFAQLRERCDQIIVVDPADAARQWALEAADPDTEVVVFGDLSQALAGLRPPFEFAVVANWGPDHLGTVTQLLQAGQLDFIIEKPLADSISDARRILAAIAEAGGHCWVNLTRRYSAMPTGVLALTEEHGLGELVAMTVTGGAKCLATNGIHFLDLALVLFGDEPESVVADVDVQRINPRAEHLVFLGGTMAYRFSGQRMFSCTFSNLSSISQNVRLYWRDAEGEILSDGQFVLRLRDKEQVRRFPNISRTGDADIEVFRGDLSRWPDGRTGMQMLYDSALSGDYMPSGERTAEYLLAALHASDSGTRVDFPIDDALVAVDRHWGIS